VWKDLDFGRKNEDELVYWDSNNRRYWTFPWEGDLTDNLVKNILDDEQRNSRTSGYDLIVNCIK